MLYLRSILIFSNNCTNFFIWEAQFLIQFVSLLSKFFMLDSSIHQNKKIRAIANHKFKNLSILNVFYVLYDFLISAEKWPEILNLVVC